MKVTMPVWRVPAILLLAFTALLLPGAAFPAAARTADDPHPTLAARRVHLYLEAAHEPLAKLAPKIYALAADSERCRMNQGSKACGLPTDPLSGSSLKQIFNYYVEQPVDALLARQHIGASKSDWTWQASPTR